MIVTMNDKQLWIEGEKAYSVEDIKSKHNSLNQAKLDLESEISKESDIIELHTNTKKDLISKLEDVNSELEGVEYIYNKIMNANKSKEDVSRDPIVVDEIVESTEPSIPEVEVPNDTVQESNNESSILNSNPKNILSHRRFRV